MGIGFTTLRTLQHKMRVEEEGRNWYLKITFQEKNNLIVHQIDSQFYIVQTINMFTLLT